MRILPPKNTLIVQVPLNDLSPFLEEMSTADYARMASTYIQSMQVGAAATPVPFGASPVLILVATQIKKHHGHTYPKVS
jgi:hypothetical protein